MAKETFKTESVNPGFIVANERLYLKADNKTVVKEGDKEAAFLLAAVGQRIPLKQAQHYGLVAPEVKAPEVKGVEPEHRSTRPVEAAHKR